MDNVLTEEYLQRFPSGIQNCLNNDKARQSFAEEIVTDFEDIEVYRGIELQNKIQPSDFLGNVEKRELDGQKYPEKWKSDFHFHSVSVNESLKELKKSLKFPNSHVKGIAVGIMAKEYGPADFVKGRNHHNWYLFDEMNRTVCGKFKVVDE